MSYQNVAADNGRSKFVQVEPDGTLSELEFDGKRTSVPLGGGIRVNASSMTASIQRRVNVAPVGEIPVYFTKRASIKFNDLSGVSGGIDEMITDLIAHLETARTSYHADDGLVPPASAVFTDPTV